MTAFLWALMAATAAVGYEAMTKAFPGATWLALLPVGILTALTTQYGIYRILHSGESLVGGLVVFSLCTALLRTGWTLAHGQRVSTAAWVAFGLVVFASVLKTVWR